MSTLKRPTYDSVRNFWAEKFRGQTSLAVSVTSWNRSAVTTSCWQFSLVLTIHCLHVDTFTKKANYDLDYRDCDNFIYTYTVISIYQNGNDGIPNFISWMVSGLDFSICEHVWDPLGNRTVKHAEIMALTINTCWYAKFQVNKQQSVYRAGFSSILIRLVKFKSLRWELSPIMSFRVCFCA